MSLLTQSPDWAYWTDNFVSVPSATNPGAFVTQGVSNAEGTPVSLLSALEHDCELLSLVAHGFRFSGSNTNTLLDILVDPSGGTSWSELITNLLVGFTTQSDTVQTFPVHYFFPVWIKAGSSVAVRAQTSRGTSNADGAVAITAVGGNRNPGSWWCGQRVESIGPDPANGRGVDHAPGNSGAFSSWADFGSPLSRRCGALQFACQGTGTGSQSNLQYLFEFGVGGSRIGPPMIKTTGSTEVGTMSPTGPLFKSLPAGAQLQVRGSCSGTAQTLDVAAYAVQ